LTDREKFLLKIFGFTAAALGIILGVSLFLDYGSSRQMELQKLHTRLASLKAQNSNSSKPDIRKQVQLLEENLWDKGSMDALMLGSFIRKTAQIYNLTIVSARIRSESDEGAFWEWQLRGDALGFFRFLDQLESLEKPLLFKSVDIRQDKNSLRITLEVGYGIKN